MKDPLDDATNIESIEDENIPQEGLTPMHRQNIDESRIDEVLVDDTSDDKDYPDIRDIADDDAVSQSYDDE